MVVTTWFSRESQTESSTCSIIHDNGMLHRKSGYQFSPYIQMKTENQTDFLTLGENHTFECFSPPHLSQNGCTSQYGG